MQLLLPIINVNIFLFCQTFSKNLTPWYFLDWAISLPPEHFRLCLNWAYSHLFIYSTAVLTMNDIIVLLKQSDPIISLILIIKFVISHLFYFRVLSWLPLFLVSSSAKDWQKFYVSNEVLMFMRRNLSNIFCSCSCLRTHAYTQYVYVNESLHALQPS